MTATRKPWLKWLLVVVVVGGGLYAALAYLTSFRAQRLVNRLLREWATQQVAEQTDSIYRLEIGSLHFNWAIGRVTLDSALLVTDSARNNARTYPRPVINGVLRTCTISGLNIAKLVLGKGLSAELFGCNTVRWDVDAPADSASLANEHAIRSSRPYPIVTPPQAAPAPAAAARPLPPPAPAAAQAARATPPAAPGARSPNSGPLMTFQRNLALPNQIPSLHIARLVFPTVAIEIIARQPNGDRSHFELGHARLAITGILIDPEHPEQRTKPAFADNVELGADDASFLPDTARAVSVGRLRLNLTDSLLTIEHFEMGPRISDAEFQRRSPYRRDRIKVAARKLEVRSFAYGDYTTANTIRARAIELDSLRFEIRSDKRKPSKPGPRTVHRSPQVWMAAFSRNLSLDTLRANGALIVYEEFAPRHENPGRLTISRVNLLGVNIRHYAGRRTDQDQMVLDIRGRLMGQGDLAVHVEVPLDAGNLAMRVRGSVGPFDAMVMNQLIEHILPARIKSGRIDGIAFQYTVTDGHARGTLTPRYHDLAADITGRGMTGILGNNPLGGLIRGAAEAAQGMKVRGSNPEHPDRPPRVGPIDYRFKGESLPAFFFNAIKGGLLGVALK